MRPLPALLLLALAAACGDDATVKPPENKPGDARLHGGYVGTTRAPVQLERGEIFLTVKGPLAPEATEQVYTTGSLLPYGYSLAGTYAKDGKLTVDGGSYTVHATTTGDVLRGTYIAPSSSGEVVLVRSGVFVFCGSTGDAQAAILAVEAPDFKVHGVLHAGDATSVLEGTRDGDTITLTSTDAHAYQLTGTVTNNESVDGTLASTAGSGTWTASTGGCTGI